MIGKVVIGKSFGGCVRYVVQKQDAQESKVFITSLSVILLTVAVSIGLAVSLGIGYIKRYHEATSYSIVRAFYPEVAK